MESCLIGMIFLECISVAYFLNNYFQYLCPLKLIFSTVPLSSMIYQKNIILIQQLTRSEYMIKYVLINRLSDGLVLCQASDGGFNQSFQNVKMQVKEYHRYTTSKSGLQSTSLKQISHSSYGIHYRISSYVVFTVISQTTYPLKLTNAFLDSIIVAFFDEAKCLLGSSNISSRIENIEGSHYFVRFDRIIKQKKKEYDDPNSIKNVDRMKKQLESIHDIMKQNMNMMDKRHQDLINTQQKAYKINEQSKKFESKSKKLVWHLWLKKNIIWLVLILGLIIVYFLF